MKEDLKSGMMFRSKTHPHFDLVIDYVLYCRSYYNYHKDEYGSIVTWYRINDEAFDNFVKEKKGATIKELLASGKNTFPYSYAGEGMPKSIKAMIRKYNMEFVGMIDKEVVVYNDDEIEYVSALKGDKESDVLCEIF